MSLPKSCDEVGIGRVAPELVDQEFRVEHVDAHAGERGIGLAGHGRRIGGLLHESSDNVLIVDMHDAEGRRVLARHFDAADRDVGALRHMLLQHELVVHLVDVIAGQHDDVFGVVALDDVDVLINGVGGAEIPAVFGNALACRQDIEALVADGAHEVPAPDEMPDQAVGLILGGDGDMPDAGVECVRQSKVDDAGFSPEVNRRLRPPSRQFHQAAAAPASQNISHRVPG